MKVYFNQNYWDTREIGLIGIPQRVDWEFSYDNQHYFIPTIYQFSEGITMDIISLLDTAKIKDFHEKYEDNINNMNEEEYLIIEAASPIQDLPLQEIYINNELAERTGGCSTNYIAGMDSIENDHVLREMQNEYGFLQGKDTSFQSRRIHVKFSKESQEDIHMLKFVTSKTEYLIPIKKHFKIDVDMFEKDHEEIFIHPITGKEHHIYINEVKASNAREVFPQYDANDPFQYVVLSYELEPALLRDERLLLKEIEQPDEVRKNKNNGASSIGLIYRNDADRFGKHGYPLEVTSTKMYWKPLDYIEMNIVGIYKEKYSEEEIRVYGYN